MAGASEVKCGALADAPASGTLGEDMVEIIAGFRDTVMTALLAWGGVSADTPAEGLRPAPAMVQEQVVPVVPAETQRGGAPVRSQSR
jgi:hypothetical protein